MRPRVDRRTSEAEGTRWRSRKRTDQKGDQKLVEVEWRNTCRRAGISNLHFHDLRREFACGLLESKADLSVVREFLGHANITTTSHYVKTSPVRMVEALERMEASAEPSDEVAESPLTAAVR